MTDVNEEAVEGWLEDTEPHERVWSILRQSGWVAVDDLADRARVTPGEVREVMDVLSDLGLAASRADEYRIHAGLSIALDAHDLLDDIDDARLDERLDELREEEGVDETTARNRAIAEVAIAIRNGLEEY